MHKVLSAARAAVWLKIISVYLAQILVYCLMLSWAAVMEEGVKTTTLNSWISRLKRTKYNKYVNIIVIHCHDELLSLLGTLKSKRRFI